METNLTQENSLFDRLMNSRLSLPVFYIYIGWLTIDAITHVAYYKITDKITEYRSRIRDLLAGGDQYFGV